MEGKGAHGEGGNEGRNEEVDTKQKTVQRPLAIFFF